MIPHPAKPLQHLAIKEDGMRERIQPHQRSGPGGGQAEKDSKNASVIVISGLSEKIKGSAPTLPSTVQKQHHYQKPLTGFQFALLFAVQATTA
ncbi:hypothetical protein ACLB1S_00290 [Escherichia coli]